MTYRDAIANVQYFVPYTRATYAASQEYVKYRATYAAETEVDSKTNFTYDLKATATYELDKSLTVKTNCDNGRSRTIDNRCLNCADSLCGVQEKKR